jgi:hypothetical protein
MLLIQPRKAVLKAISRAWHRGSSRLCPGVVITAPGKTISGGGALHGKGKKAHSGAVSILSRRGEPRED